MYCLHDYGFVMQLNFLQPQFVISLIGSETLNSKI